MATVEEIIYDFLGSVKTSAGAPLISRWVSNRYREMMSKVKFRHLRKVGELKLFAKISDGLVTATNDSTTVTPNATAAAAILAGPGDGAQEYWFIRISSNWYLINSIAAITGVITLNTSYVETSVSDTSYELVKRYYTLDSTARWIGDFFFPRLRRQIREISLDELNILYPSRIIAGYPSTFAAQIGVDSVGSPMYEIYPPANETELVNYVYWTLPTTLTLTTTIPEVIDPYTIKEGIMVDFYRFEKIRAIDKGNVDQSAVLANEEAKQRTIWKQVIKDAIRTSRGSDDISFILEMTHGASPVDRDQRTARDYILDNWRR